MNSVIYLVAAVGSGVLNGLMAVSLKAGEQKNCRPVSFGMVFMGVAALLSLVVAWQQGSGWKGGWFWTLGAAGGVMEYGGVQAMMRANALGPASLVWTMANMGLLVPIVLSAVFLAEPLRPVDGVLLVSFVLMLAAFHRGLRGGNGGVPLRLRPYALGLAALFLCSGLAMFTFKLYNVWVPSAGTARLSFVMYGTAACLSAVNLLARRGWVSLSAAERRLGTAAGLAGGGSLLLMLPAMCLPAATVFPVVQGVGMLSGVILTGFIFRESVNAWKILGVVLSLGVVLLAVFR